MVEEELRLDFDISESHVLGVTAEYVHIKGNKVVLLIPREMYIRVWNMWLNRKAEYCKLWNHYCGVGGYIDVIESVPTHDITLNDYDQNNENIIEVVYKAFIVKQVGNYIDMEHG
jgi:hypothetical protein